MSTLERVAYLMRKDERLDVLHFRDTGQLFIGRDILGVVAECKTIHTWDWNHIRGRNRHQLFPGVRIDLFGCEVCVQFLTYISENPEIQDPIRKFP